MQVVKYLVHNALFVQDNTGAYHPQLALELPSVDRQTWRVNSDGTMETIWRIHESVTWHDGTPFTSADLLFSFGLLKDPSLPGSNVPGLAQMESASAPDPLTFSIHWSGTFADADHSPDVGPAPKHLLEELHQQSDPAAFVNSPYFTTGFVGLGPFRLFRWKPGLSTEFERFDSYYLGPAALDRIVLRYIGDDNALISNVLSGGVDVAVPGTAEIGSILEVKRQWEGTGNLVTIDTINQMRYIEIQVRPEYARPGNGLTVTTVRQALYQAIDRPALAAAVSYGLAPAADSWFSPSDPLRAQIESSIPQYPYDAKRAQVLLAEAGWVRGSDGVLFHQTSGERFETELWSRPGHEAAAQIVADDWKAVGAQTKTYALAVAQLTDRELTSTYPGGVTVGLAPSALYGSERLYSRNIAGPANRWLGRNQGGYSNPTADDIQERLAGAIEPEQRLALHRQLLQLVMGDLPIMPLRWNTTAALALKVVKGPVTAQETGWNIYLWDKA